MKLKHPIYLPEPPTIAELERQARHVRLLCRLALVFAGFLICGAVLLIYR
jgi:hypothetical protein